MLVEDLIPNHQLRLISEWYARQVLISDNMEENEIVRPPNSDYSDIMMILQKYTVPPPSEALPTPGLGAG